MSTVKLNSEQVGIFNVLKNVTLDFLVEKKIAEKDDSVAKWLNDIANIDKELEDIPFEISNSEISKKVRKEWGKKITPKVTIEDLGFNDIQEVYEKIIPPMMGILNKKDLTLDFEEETGEISFGYSKEESLETLRCIVLLFCPDEQFISTRE